MKKRILSVFLTAVMCLSVVASFGVTASAALKRVDVREGVYIIYSNVGNSMVLDVAGGSTASGTNVQIYKSNNSNAQLFKIKKVGNYYTISNYGSGMNLDVYNGSSASGANVWMYKPNNSNAQKWAFYDAGNGYVYIRSLVGQNALDVYNGNNINGTNVRMYKYNGSAAQRWKLVRGIMINGAVYDRFGRQCTDGAVVTLYSEQGNYIASTVGYGTNFSLFSHVPTDITPGYIIVDAKIGGDRAQGKYVLSNEDMQKFYESKKINIWMYAYEGAKYY